MLYGDTEYGEALRKYKETTIKTFDWKKKMMGRKRQDDTPEGR